MHRSQPFETYRILFKRSVTLCLLALLCGWSPATAQIPVLSWVIYDGELRIEPQNPDYEVWLTTMQKEEDSPNENLLQTYDPDSFFYPYAFAHPIPDPVAQYDLHICHEMDTMTIHLQTWFVDWYQANFLVQYRPGDYCFDMRDAAEAHEGIAPLSVKKYLRKAGGDCFGP